MAPGRRRCGCCSGRSRRRLAALWLVGTTPYPDLFAPISRVLPRSVGDGLFLTYRALFELRARADRLWRAHSAARRRVERPPRRRLTLAGEGLGTLVLHGFERSQRLYAAMHAARPLRPRLRLPALGRVDARRLGGGRGWARARAGGRAAVGPVMSDTSRPVQAAGDPLVRVSCVRHTYPDRTQVHLCGLDFVVERGERVVMLGPNGCGKTTLLYHILGLLEPQEGEVSVFGVNPARQFHQDPRARRRAAAERRRADHRADGVGRRLVLAAQLRLPDAEVERLVHEALERVGITHLRHKVCHHLSGGEKRKVALAGALVLKPELLVLDEPFEGLDPASRTDLCDLLNGLHRRPGRDAGDGDPRRQCRGADGGSRVRAAARRRDRGAGPAGATSSAIPGCSSAATSSRRCWPSCSSGSRQLGYRSAGRSRRTRRRALIAERCARAAPRWRRPPRAPRRPPRSTAPPASRDFAATPAAPSAG